MDYFAINVGTLMARLDNILIVIGVVFLVAAISGVLSTLTRRSISPMPLFEMMMRPVAVFLIDRLNRYNRGAFSLIVRGVIVYVVLACLTFFILWAARHFVPYHYVDIAFLIFVVSPLSVILIALRLSKPTPPKQTYFHVAQALNRNLIKVDASGHRRNGFDVFALSLGEWFIAPLFFYMIGGIGFAYFYSVLSLFCRVAGAQGQSTLFASLFGTVWVGLQFIPNIIASVVIVFASLFTPKGKFLSALRAIPTRPLFTAYAYALGITLGGAYQDRHGQAVERAWIGAAKSSAKITHKDILRGCYLHGITVLLVVVSLVAARLVF